MTTAVKSPNPKITIDPKCEGGIVALAEAALPPNAERTACAQALQGPWHHFCATRARIARAIESQEDIAAALAKAPDEPARAKLEERRAEMTTTLLHAATDIEAAASPFATALGLWAKAAHQDAVKAHRAVSAEINPLRLERRRLYSAINPDLPRDRKTGTQLAALEKQFADLTVRIEPLVNRQLEIEGVADGVKAAVRHKFGEARNGDLFDQSGRRRWVAGVRDAVARRTTGLTGISDALRPRAI